MIARVEVGLVIRVEDRTSLESRFGKPRVIEISILGTLLSCTIALLKAKNLSSLLRAIKTLKKFFGYFRIK